MTKKLLYQGQPGASSALAFTTSAMTTIDAATVFNNSASASIVLEVWLFTSGGTAVEATKVDHITVGTETRANITGLINQAVPSGGAVHLKAGTATELTVTISGRTA